MRKTVTSRSSAAVALFAAGSLLMTGCGSRVSDARVEAANAAVIHLNDDQLKAAGIDPAAGAGANGAAAPVAGDTTVPAATTTTTTPTTPRPPCRHTRVLARMGARSKTHFRSCLLLLR